MVPACVTSRETQFSCNERGSLNRLWLAIASLMRNVPVGVSDFVIAHPTPAIGSAGSLTASTKRMVSNTEARLAFAVLTTGRKAA